MEKLRSKAPSSVGKQKRKSTSEKRKQKKHVRALARAMAQLGVDDSTSHAQVLENEYLKVSIRHLTNEVFFKLKKNTKLKKLMNAFCDRQGRDPKTVHFVFDGRPVTPQDTATSLGLKDGDTIGAENVILSSRDEVLEMLALIESPGEVSA